MVLAAIAWACLSDPDVPFLADHGEAEWIVFPQPPTPAVRPAVALEAHFTRRFELRSQPDTAQLSVRGFRAFAVSINGRPALASAEGANWKRASGGSVAELLRQGENEISVVVRNHRGPPALWLELRANEQWIASDAGWEVTLAGSTLRPARLARDLRAAVNEWYAFPAPARSIDALRDHAGALAVVALLAAAVVLAARSLERRCRRKNGEDRIEVALFAALAIAWGLLSWNNGPSLSHLDGFDVTGHLEYVQYVLDHARAPMPDEGWEMFQPPLYYALAALALAVSGLSTQDAGALVVLRCLSLLSGIGMLACVAWSLRLLFPDRPRARWLGLLLAGFVPMNLYLFHFPTNETLAAALAALAVCGMLRVASDDEVPFARCAWLGVCLGAAMLAKFSALVVVVVALPTLAVRLVKSGAPWSTCLAKLGTTLGAALAVCGWRFAEIWARFGKPFVPAWEAAPIDPFWQDPGFHTSNSLFGLRLALESPQRAALGSVADGVYATLWADGLSSGHRALWAAPAWNSEWMALGGLLALVPCLGIGVGVLYAMVRVLRRRDPAWSALLAVAASSALLLLYLNLTVPSHAHAKAFFALAAAIPMSAFGALGLDWLSRRSRPIATATLVGFGCWAIFAYATYWIPRDAAHNHARLGRLAVAAGDWERARVQLRFAAEREPSQPLARLGAAELELRQGEVARALDALGPTVPPDRPTRAEFALMRARILALQGAPEAAIPRYLEALRGGANADETHLNVALALRGTGEVESAIRHLREAIAARPDLGEAHAALGSTLRSEGRLEPALYHLRLASVIRPRDPVALTEAAWILATHPDPTRRRPEEAIDRAERAAALTGSGHPMVLDALAAAYASAGDFDRAVAAAGRAVAAATREPALQQAIAARRALYARAVHE
ncbi:MAG: tetratricopeptide repeat protein [Deltaproteobacteria bacterium]|nr:tetratricopeptide repeat protein [Deltaproteobacteria bacterium]